MKNHSVAQDDHTDGYSPPALSPRTFYVT